MKDYLLNRIWEEMKQANTNMYYAEVIIDRQTMIAKYRNFVVLLFSGGGAALYLVDTIIPACTSIAVAAATVVTQFMQSDGIERICRLHTNYTTYFNHLQDLYLRLNFDKIDVQKALEHLNGLIENNAGRQTEISQVFGKINKKFETFARNKSKTYLNRVYNCENSNN